MPIDALVTRLVAASRAAFTEVRERHPEESFYCFGLLTSELATYIGPTCSGERGLRDVAGEYAERSGGTVAENAADLRWSPCDSPYDQMGEEHFDEVVDLLRDRPDPYDLDDDACEQEVHERFASCFQALARLDAEGFFGRGAERERVVVTVLQGDQSDRSRLANARRLNPPSVVERLAGELGVPEPLGDFVTLGSRGSYQVNALAHAPDAGLLAACGSGGEVYVWEPGTGREVLATEVEEATFRDAAMSADGRVLLLAANEGLWRVALPDTTPRRVSTGSGWRVAVSPGGTVVAMLREGRVSVGPLDGTERYWRLGFPASCLRFSPDGTLLAVAGDGAGAPGVALFDAADGSLCHELVPPGSGRGHCLAWSSDGQVLAAADRFAGPARTWHRQGDGWRPGAVFELPDAVATGAPVLDAPEDLAFAPSGKLLASAHANGDVHVWDAATGAHLRRLRGLQESMLTVVFLDDGHLAAAGRDVDSGPPVYVWAV